MELSNVANNPLLGFAPTYGTSTYKLTPQDSLLVEKGGSSLRALDIYHNLATDPHVFACIDKISQEIISREFVVKPFDESVKAREISDWVTEMLTSLGQDYEDDNEYVQIADTHSMGLDALFKSFSFAQITGYQPAEVIWGIDKDDLPYPRAVKPKDPRRFTFEANSEGAIFPKILLNTRGYDGLYLPKRKFIFHTYWSIATDDPYGMSLSRQIYYPVLWKREAFTYWLTILDRFSDPIALGKAPDHATDEQLEAFKSFLVGISRETSAVLPEGFEVSFETVSLGGVKDVLEALIESCDRHISLAILGEAVTGEQVGSALGSQKETIGNSIRIMKAKAISEGICNTLNNTLIKWAVKYRFGEDAPVPTLHRIFEDKKDLSLILSHFQTLKLIGFPIDFSQIEELTGYRILNQDGQVKSGKKSVEDILAGLNDKTDSLPDSPEETPE